MDWEKNGKRKWNDNIGNISVGKMINGPFPESA